MKAIHSLKPVLVFSLLFSMACQRSVQPLQSDNLTLDIIPGAQPRGQESSLVGGELPQGGLQKPPPVRGSHDDGNSGNSGVVPPNDGVDDGNNPSGGELPEVMVDAFLQNRCHAQNGIWLGRHCEFCLEGEHPENERCVADVVEGDDAIDEGSDDQPPAEPPGDSFPNGAFPIPNGSFHIGGEAGSRIDNTVNVDDSPAGYIRGYVNPDVNIENIGEAQVQGD